MVCVSRRPVKEEFLVLWRTSRVFWLVIVPWRSCVMEAVLSSSVSGMLAMAASLLNATLYFLKTWEYLLLSCFPVMMWPSFNVRLWKPLKPKLISTLVMQLLNEGGHCWEGGVRARVLHFTAQEYCSVTRPSCSALFTAAVLNPH